MSSLSRSRTTLSPAASERSTLPMGASVEPGSEDLTPLEPTREQLLAHFFERFKFYTSLTLGTVAILAVFAFLFLIPFVVEPAIQTILAEFVPEAGICAVSEHVYAQTMSNCSWASCREGCTTTHTKCHKIRVNLARTPFSDDAPIPKEWDEVNLKFLINPEGCGYPPRVNCSEFAHDYAGKKAPKIFPCYYSLTRPDLVVARYSWESTIRGLILALVLPTTVFVFSLSVLAYWHCHCCDRACNRRVHAESFASKEDSKLLCELDDDPSDDVF
ncbi:protein tipE isoform X2 [Aricia agestis]|uniref:protein tipE isoform X2 n=1 Tax=Aricia agestis TaxID=91739 RepID=UPI001C2081AA|nr:protein tipE isoform X2 [Aricia agestis]XP_041982880.1 protein tipE isoform X2 [Aricia agestis]